MDSQQETAAAAVKQHALLLAHLRKRKRSIRQRHCAFNICMLFVLTGIPTLIIWLLLSRPVASAGVMVIVTLAVFIPGCSLLFMMHLRSESAIGLDREAARRSMQWDLLERGLLREVLHRRDPRELLDRSRMDEQAWQELEAEDFPDDATGRIDFLMYNFHRLNRSMLKNKKAGLADPENSDAVLPPVVKSPGLDYGHTMLLIDVLIDILEGRIGEETGDD